MSSNAPKEYVPEPGPPSGRTRSQTRGVIQEAQGAAHFFWRPSPAQQPPPPQQTAPTIDPKWARQEQINSRLLEIQQEQEAHGHAVDRRLAAIERDQDILHSRVHALELHVFNRSYPPQDEDLALRAAWPFTGQNLANRLANRVAAIERAVMTIPVGTTVNIVNPGGPLHDDDSDVVNESEVEFYDETSEEDES